MVRLMVCSILNSIFDDIRQIREISGVFIEDLDVSTPFTILRLSDGSVGSAGNYDVQNGNQRHSPSDARAWYLSHVASDPLLMETLGQDNSLTGLSLKTSVLSALSQPFFHVNGLRNLGYGYQMLADMGQALAGRLRPGDTVTVVGFGGLLDAICRSPQVAHVYVCDFLFREARYRKAGERRLAKLGRRFGGYTFLDGTQYSEALASSSVSVITGSTVCNGTIEELLALSSGCREVILQGPSCSLLPTEFFRRSVTLVVTTHKLREEWDQGVGMGNHIYSLVDRSYFAMYPEPGGQQT
jgi:hypothetical protein